MRAYMAGGGVGILAAMLLALTAIIAASTVPMTVLCGAVLFTFGRIGLARWSEP